MTDREPSPVPLQSDNPLPADEQQALGWQLAKAQARLDELLNEWEALAV